MKRLFFANGIVYFTSLWFIVKTTPEELIGPFAADVPDIPNLIVYVIYGLSFFGTLSYCFILGFIKGKAIGDKQLQKIRMTTFGISLLFLIPLIVLIATGKTRVTVVCLSFMFLTISIINLYFSIFFANKPYYFNNGSLTAHFISHFKISDREKEVIALLLEGMANKEIAEVLFISPRTVENHLSSIYQKAEVNSRVQLINLIRANTSS
jgi:DNA-binding CsgD family transcriptional regulator